MRRIGNYKIFIALMAMLLTSLAAFGQEFAPTVEQKKGSVRFTAQFEINGKTEKLDRKRFYLVRGSRQQNADLLKNIAETVVTSRDCYYADLQRGGRKISDEFFCWLKTNDCESPYCREVKTKEEALAVPEFAVAYKIGLREYRQSALALKWLTTNLPDDIRDGYYRQQKNVLGKLVDLARFAGQETSQVKRGSAKKGDGFQSIMTDRLGNAYFLDVDIVPPEGKKTETYLITNLLPTVFGDTGFVWSCEVEIDPSKQIQVNLKNELGKKKCEVVTRKLTEVCTLPDCSKPPEKPAEAN
ncbi:MAG: hypothetical protein LH472_02085 [Pyrinomonadaceae bacterium]|nr:hypothetical protein [Pyrinomonadaceae bacterium]